LELRAAHRRPRGRAAVCPHWSTDRRAGGKRFECLRLRRVRLGDGTRDLRTPVVRRIRVEPVERGPVRAEAGDQFLVPGLGEPDGRVGAEHGDLCRRERVAGGAQPRTRAQCGSGMCRRVLPGDRLAERDEVGEHVSVREQDRRGRYLLTPGDRVGADVRETGEPGVDPGDAAAQRVGVGQPRSGGAIALHGGVGGRGPVHVLCADAVERRGLVGRFGRLGLRLIRRYLTRYVVQQQRHDEPLLVQRLGNVGTGGSRRGERAEIGPLVPRPRHSAERDGGDGREDEDRDNRRHDE
jgi:hypothetical protein